MVIRGLLSRLDATDAHAPTVGNPRDSIVEHLKMLLNTRKGQVAASPDYGIPDFNDIVHVFPAAIARMQSSIQTAIESFEPRLTNVLVRHAPDEDEPSSLQFEITAQLARDGGRNAIRLYTRLGKGGQMQLW
ncbi:type VI secretion system baseplate subunit TssE [Pyxidicoccus sp. 3LG]